MPQPSDPAKGGPEGWRVLTGGWGQEAGRGRACIWETPQSEPGSSPAKNTVRPPSASVPIVTCRSIRGDPAGIRSTQSEPSWAELGRRVEAARVVTGRQALRVPDDALLVRAAGGGVAGGGGGGGERAVLLGDRSLRGRRQLPSPIIGLAVRADADRGRALVAVGVVADVGVDALGAQGLLEAGGVVEPVHGDDDVAVPVELHGVRRRGAAVPTEADDPDDAGGQTCGDRADGEPADPAAARASWLGLPGGLLGDVGAQLGEQRGLERVQWCVGHGRTSI